MSIFFFFKQKTAYEMRISDWSSDVCSSDLGGIEHRAEHVRRTPQVLQRQLHEQRLVALPGGGLLADAGVVGAAVADRLVEDRRVGCQPGDAVLVDVALQRAVVEDLAGDVVQPEALADVARGVQVGDVDSCRSVLDSLVPSGYACR